MQGRVALVASDVLNTMAGVAPVEPAGRGLEPSITDAIIQADRIMGHISTVLETVVPSALADLLAKGAQAWCFPPRDAEDEGEIGRKIFDDLSIADASPADTILEIEDDSDTTENLKPTIKICVSCEEAMPLSDFASLAPGTVCTHSNNTCTDCWQQWLEAQLNNADIQATDISCAQCPSKLHQNNIQAFASQTLFDRYHRATICLLLSKEQDFRWCVVGSCTSGQVHDTRSEGNIFACVECGHKSCVDCNSEWHAGQTCEAFQEEKAALRQWEYLKSVDVQRRRGSISDKAASILVTRKRGVVSRTLGRLVVEEAESAEAIEKHSKRCPGCHSRIQKNG